MRGSAADVIRPNTVDVRDVFGLPRFTRVNRLNTPLRGSVTVTLAPATVAAEASRIWPAMEAVFRWASSTPRDFVKTAYHV